jgi:hypothetical protein
MDEKIEAAKSRDFVSSLEPVVFTRISLNPLIIGVTRLSFLKK